MLYALTQAEVNMKSMEIQICASKIQAAQERTRCV